MSRCMTLGEFVLALSIAYIAGMLTWFWIDEWMRGK